MKLHYILFLVLVFGCSALAEEKPTDFKNFGSDNNPTYIKSDQLTLLSKERKFTYSGNMQMVNGDLTIFGDKADGAYDQNNKITDLVCSGNVLITKGEKIRATGGKATYVAQNATIVLTENPELSQDGSVLSADKVTIFLNEDRSMAEGQVRVKLQEQNKKEEPGPKSLKRAS